MLKFKINLKLIISTFLFLMINSNAYAYIDPGLGSIMLQAIIAMIAGSNLINKIYWKKIKDFFKKKKNKDFNSK